MSLGAIVLLIVLILLFGGFRDWGSGPFYGGGPWLGGGFGIIVVILLILVLTGQF